MNYVEPEVQVMPSAISTIQAQQLGLSFKIGCGYLDIPCLPPGLNLYSQAAYEADE